MPLLQMLLAENMFLGLQRVQFRFGTQIIKAYTDKGLQLGQILEKINDFWSVKLCGTIKLFNNATMAQYRNIFERR